MCMYRGKQIPGTHWLPSLAKLMIFMFNETFKKIKVRANRGKRSDIDLGPFYV